MISLQNIYLNNTTEEHLTFIMGNLTPLEVQNEKSTIVYKFTEYNFTLVPTSRNAGNSISQWPQCWVVSTHAALIGAMCA